MGSRVDVTITLRTKDFLKAYVHGIRFGGCDNLALLDGDHPEGLVEALFGDSSNAEAGIEHALKSLSIPFDRIWEGDGCDIEAGESFFRIDRSGPVEKSFDTASAWQIPFHELESAYEQGKVGDLIERTRDTFKVMTWDEQAAYLKQVDAEGERMRSEALMMLSSLKAEDALKQLDLTATAQLAQKILGVPVDSAGDDAWYAGPDHKIVASKGLAKLIEQGFEQMSLVRRIRHLHGIVNEEGEL
jgi:hypothetical protein